MNETFRKLGHITGLLAAVLEIINLIICFVKGVKAYDKLEDDIMDVVGYQAELMVDSLLYKVCVGMFAFAFVMLFISFIVNVSGVRRVIMMIVKLVQLAFAVALLASAYHMNNPAGMKLSALGIAGAALLTFLLYMTDRDHRGTAVKLLILSTVSIGIAVVYTIAICIIIMIIVLLILKLIIGFFSEPVHKTKVLDANGKLLYFLVRD